MKMDKDLLSEPYLKE